MFSIINFIHFLFIFFLLIKQQNNVNGLKLSFLTGRLPFLSPNSEYKDHLNNIKQWIIGDYDNLKQATADAAAGRPDAVSGGHEHIVAKITQHPDEENIVIAAYFFGKETKPFRFRYYEFLINHEHQIFEEEYNKKFVLFMRLLKPSREYENQLNIHHHHHHSNSNNNNSKESSLPAPELSSFELIRGAEIGWRRTNWLQRLFFGAHYRGELINGQCIIPSQRDPNMMITIRDDLYLWSNELWINDRVYAPNGTLLIGNSRNIPYKLQKKKMYEEQSIMKN